MGGLGATRRQDRSCRHPEHALPERCKGTSPRWARSRLRNSAQEVVLSHDPEQAARISQDDDAMDELHKHLFTVLMDKEWKHGFGAVSKQTTYESLETSCRRWHGDMTDIVDQR
jgi:phosphate transport system protein